MALEDYRNNTFPAQRLPYNKKGKEWRKRHLDWASNKSYATDSSIRKSVIHKKINFDLLGGKVSCKDMESVLNPDSIKADYITKKIQHYPIMNSKLNVLIGEEIKRNFDYRIIVTNPLAISEKESRKKEELFSKLKDLIMSSGKSEEEIQKELTNLNEYYTYDWQDLREIRANQLLNHYYKELNVDDKFSKGFINALAVGEEFYQCDIIQNEPVVEVLNPLKLRVFMSGYSSRIEDADVIIYEDYWSPGKITDVYYDSLTESDLKKLDEYSPESSSDNMDNYHEAQKFVRVDDLDMMSESFSPVEFDNIINANTNPYDGEGNIRVLRVYWKSKRRIKKVKSYDELTGEEQYDFYPETYKINKDLGEEEEIFWINEAWEGTKIGKDIYLNMRPRKVQYNRLSNPSRCHFGIIGSLYNLNESKPYSLVDMMKPYNYLYDAVKDRLNLAISANWGKIVKLDLAQVPKGWDVNKWLYFARINKIAVTDSFKEGNIGAAKGKIAGNLNNNSTGVIDAETGNNIQQNINLLEFIKMEMSEVVGISRQREGQISNRETVGGVERATLQSSHITEWLFNTHDDVKKRVIECLLETSKIAIKGRSKKFQYILSDNSTAMVDIDGDEFAEADYGLLPDGNNSADIREQLIQLAHAGLQTQTLSFSSIMKIFNNNNSVASIQRIIEKDEQAIQQRQAEAQQQKMKENQMMIDAQNADRKAERELKDLLNQRDNDTKLAIAGMKESALTEEGLDDFDRSDNSDDLFEKIRQFDIKMDLERKKHSDNIDIKEKELAFKKKALDNKPINKK